MNHKLIDGAFDIKNKHVQCFPAGTLVHTDKGLVPIQDVKVGDMVLSRAEWDGIDASTEYKRVLRAFCSGEDELIRLSCQRDSEYDDIFAPIYIEFMTPNHPIWDESLKDWIPASKIEVGTLLSNIDNEDNLRVLAIDAVYQADLDNDLLIGGCFSINLGNERELDIEILFSKDKYYFINYNKYVSSNEYHILDTQIVKFNPNIHEEIIDYIYSNRLNLQKLKVPVYNLEIEDNYTYFIGEHAIWVHNDNCFDK
jgi:hypothetical protein